MHGIDEVRLYLMGLLEHESACMEESCSLCLSAENVYTLIRKVIFSSTEYPQVAIRGQRKPAPTSDQLAGIAAVSSNATEAAGPGCSLMPDEQMEAGADRSE